MMKKLIQNLVLAGLAFTPLAALAVGPGAGEYQDFGPEAGIFGDIATTPGAFADSFTFGITLPSTGLVTLGVDLSGKTKGISGLTFELLDGSTPVIGNVTTTVTKLGPFTVDSYSDTFSALAPGTYTLDVNGTFLKNGGEYTGSWSVLSAVPEPSTWAAMLVGLCLMGYTLRRRQTGF